MLIIFSFIVSIVNKTTSFHHATSIAFSPMTPQGTMIAITSEGKNHVLMVGMAQIVCRRRKTALPEMINMRITNVTS